MALDWSEILGLPDGKDLLPPIKEISTSVPHAPVRVHEFGPSEFELAIRNALRYFPTELHEILGPEFEEELKTYGHIYMYRFRPSFELRACPLEDIPAKNRHAAAMMLMILNNLDPAVAQFPHELVTYGGNGQVFSNWAQFRLTMKYLSEMTEQQTLVLNSGHPLGLFPSKSESPRAVICNGLVIPNSSAYVDYDYLFGLGVSMYGQMTAGSYCYIGPQGIVHGTTLTLMNAGRKYLGLEDLSGKVFVTSGLGGMSGAQAKAAVIAGCIGIVAEVCSEALYKRAEQGWVKEVEKDLDKLIDKIREYRRLKKATSIGYYGNIVDLWERLVAELEDTGDLLVDLGSDQTSCHNPFNGGYYPVGLSKKDADLMMAVDNEGFTKLVQESLQRHVAAINKLSAHGMRFWDYGNAFLLQALRAGADVESSETKESKYSCPTFRYPSYIQDIIGNIFSLGFGPFRWVCTSCTKDDLRTTDEIAAKVLRQRMEEEDVPQNVREQYKDNLRWIEQAKDHQLVVGSQARILYSDMVGRVRLALAFNQAVGDGSLKAPVVVSRDHHDVSGADSPFRETSNIMDGSSFTADMAVQNCIGDAFRGATWVALHNGGGVGWGEAINGGFGLVLDGTEEAANKARLMLGWDVANGVARRAWSGNPLAVQTIRQSMAADPLLKVTLPHI